MTAAPRERIQSIDALRGLCIILMVAYHFLFDLTEFAGLPIWIFTNPIFNLLQPIIAGCFILLAGISSRYSRNNVKRGIKVFAAGMLITLITYAMGIMVRFGILHLLGCSMVIYGLGHRWIDRIPQKAAPLFYGVLFVVARWIFNRTYEIGWLFVFGITDKDFFSADYYPVFPWIFIFLLGTWMGKLVVERRLPNLIYTIQCNVLPAIGRKSLLIYLLHQPVLYALTLVVQKLLILFAQQTG